MIREAGSLNVGGSFSGNTVSKEEGGNTVVAKQEVNADVLEKISTAYEKPGADMLHEVTESYKGAKDITEKWDVFTPSWKSIIL